MCLGNARPFVLFCFGVRFLQKRINTLLLSMPRRNPQNLHRNLREESSALHQDFPTAYRKSAPFCKNADFCRPTPERKMRFHTASGREGAVQVRVHLPPAIGGSPSPCADDDQQIPLLLQVLERVFAHIVRGGFKPFFRACSAARRAIFAISGVAAVKDGKRQGEHPK